MTLEQEFEIELNNLGNKPHRSFGISKTANKKFVECERKEGLPLLIIEKIKKRKLKQGIHLYKATERKPRALARG